MKGYLAYLALIVILLFALFLYVRGIMLQYERNSPENYVIWLAKTADERSELGKYLEQYNFGDKRYGDPEARRTSFYAAARSAELEVKAASGSYDSLNPAYEIKADGKPFMNIAIKEVGRSTKLGIMSLSDWEIDYCIVRNPNSSTAVKIGEDKALEFTLTMPSDFILLVDGYQAAVPGAEESESVTLSEFSYVKDFVEAPSGIKFRIGGLYYEPEFSALNNGNEEIAFESKLPGQYSLKADYAASPEAKALAESICDPLAIGKLWSKFMTDDVGGAHHGRDTVIKDCKLLKGTNLYSLAQRWSSNVDITFVSGHTLDSWSEESVTNYIQYNDELFSCDVYFKKNMTIKRGIGPRTDVFSNRMFFGRVKNNWYLLDMITLDK